MGASVMDILANYNPSGFQRKNQDLAAQVAQRRAMTQQADTVTAGEQLKNQVAQRDLNDQDILRRAYTSTDGTPDQMRKYLITNGISAPAYTAWQQHDLDLRTKASQL